MGLLGIEQLGRPGKLSELFLVCTVASLANIVLLSIILLFFGLVAGSVLQALRTAIFLGATVGGISSTIISLRHGITAELNPNASLGTRPVAAIPPIKSIILQYFLPAYCIPQALGIVVADLVSFAAFGFTHIVFLPWDTLTFLLALAVAAGSAFVVALPIAGALLDPHDRLPKLE